MTPDTITIDILLDTGESALDKPRVFHETWFELVDNHPVLGPAAVNLRVLDLGQVVRVGTATSYRITGPSGIVVADLDHHHSVDPQCSIAFRPGTLAIERRRWDAIVRKPEPAKPERPRGGFEFL